MDSQELAATITTTIAETAASARTVTTYRTPLIAWTGADNPQFAELQRIVGPHHLLPQDLLPGARSVLAFFLPFAEEIVHANAREKNAVAEAWARAYIETNALIRRMTDGLIAEIASMGVHAAAQPPTHNFDPTTLLSAWSHKSIAVITGLGSFGLHHQVITDAGCAGRLGSLVLDADLPPQAQQPRTRCMYHVNGSCSACAARCPTGVLSKDGVLDKARCWARCLENAEQLKHLGVADVCGKCSVAVCATKSPV